MAIIFSGREFANSKEDKLKPQVTKLQKQGKTPLLAVILVGDDPASLLYVHLKQQAAVRIGVNFKLYHLTAAINETEVISLLQHLGQDSSVTGIMLQLPLPQEFNPEEILSLIPKEKDVDGLRPDTIKLIEKGRAVYLPATVAAVAAILAEASASLSSQPFSHWIRARKVAVVGAAGQVGRPLVAYLESQAAQVTALEKGDPLAKALPHYEVVISSVGQPHLIKPDWISPKSLIIDVGQAKINGKPAGDFDPQVAAKTSFFTPVPGGVGPVTVSCLLENLVKAQTLKTNPT